MPTKVVDNPLSKSRDRGARSDDEDKKGAAGGKGQHGRGAGAPQTPPAQGLSRRQRAALAHQHNTTQQWRGAAGTQDGNQDRPACTHCGRRSHAPHECWYKPPDKGGKGNKGDKGKGKGKKGYAAQTGAWADPGASAADSYLSFLQQGAGPQMLYPGQQLSLIHI